MADIVVFSPNPAQLQEAEKIGNGWKGFGNKLALTKMELIFKAGQLKPDLPTKVEDIAAADVALAQLKKDYNELEALRKTITGQWDYKVLPAMMAPGKEVAAHIKLYEAALIPLKQLKRNQENAAAEKNRALQQFREQTEIAYNNFLTNCEKIIQNKKLEVFAFALKNVHAVDIDKYIDRLKSECSVSWFFIGEVKDADPVRQQIINDITGKYEPATYVTKYWNELPGLFADFATAKKNATDAILAQQVKTSEANKQISQTNELANVGASFSAAAISTSVPTLATKQLKTVWVVDMPHNETNMVNIMRAFVNNLVSVMPTIKVSDCFNITIQQMSDALARLKNLDPNLIALVGKDGKDVIIFSQKDKI